MFDQAFAIKLALSFLAGTAIAAITLYSAQRFGPKTGGLIAGLPSTTAVGLFFIGYTQTPEAAATASTIVPAAVGGSLVFVMAYVTLCEKKNYIHSLLAATMIWFAIALPLTILKIENPYFSSLIFITAWIVAVKYLKSFDGAAETSERIKQSKEQTISRSLFAGCVILFAVYASNALGPLWGGVFAAFPALFFSMFIVLGKSYGCDYTTTLAKNTPLGLFSVAPYVWGVHYFYPAYGIFTGTALAYVLAFIAAAIIYKLSAGFIKKKRS